MVSRGWADISHVIWTLQPRLSAGENYRSSFSFVVGWLARQDGPRLVLDAYEKFYLTYALEYAKDGSPCAPHTETANNDSVKVQVLDSLWISQVDFALHAAC